MHGTGIIRRPNELTDESYWDQRWQHHGRVKILSPRHGLVGRNGILLRTMQRHLGRLDRISVLELGGGGSSRLLALAKWTGSQVVAIDYSHVGIQKTEAMFAANDCHVETVLGDFFEWDARGRTFDLVVHWGVLEHFPDPTPVMKLCADLLAPGGTLLFSMPNMEAWGAYFWRRWCPANWSLHIHHSDRAVSDACEAAGLQLRKQLHFGPPLLQATDWERSGLLPRTISIVHLSLMLLGWVIPIYHRGLRQISSERGFIAQKPVRKSIEKARVL